MSCSFLMSCHKFSCGKISLEMFSNIVVHFMCNGNSFCNFAVDVIETRTSDFVSVGCGF